MRRLLLVGLATACGIVVQSVADPIGVPAFDGAVVLEGRGLLQELPIVIRRKLALALEALELFVRSDLDDRSWVLLRLQQLVLLQIDLLLAGVYRLNEARLVEVLQAFLQLAEHQVVRILLINAKEGLEVLVLSGRLFDAVLRQLLEELLGREQEHFRIGGLGLHDLLGDKLLHELVEVQALAAVHFALLGEELEESFDYPN